MRTLNNPQTRRQLGFTLAEVLIAGSLGAILLTALTYATIQFGMGISHMELKSGVTSADDAALRQITRDIRESWHAEIVSEQKIKLFDELGAATEYSFANGELSLIRPNGDSGVVVGELLDVEFEGSYVVRAREGSPLDLSGGWWSRSIDSFGALSYEVPGGNQLALAFTVPVLASDLPVPGSDEEQVIEAAASTFNMPLAFVDGTNPEALLATLYEARGPGAAKPYGDAVLSLSLPGSSLPAAVPVASDWEVPGDIVSLSTAGLSNELVPGRGYVLVLEATGDAQLVLAAELASSGDDEIRLNSVGSAWAPMFPSLSMPLGISGSYAVTSTATSSQVNRISVTLFPDSRPDLTRSASILSQAYSDDPWHGVVDGQDAP